MIIFSSCILLLISDNACSSGNGYDLDLKYLNRSGTLNPWDYFKLLKQKWLYYRNESKDSSREQKLKKILPSMYIMNKANDGKDNGGGHHNSSIGYNTIILHVIETTMDLENDRYKSFIRNILCFEKQFGMKSLVYVIDHDTKNLQLITEQLKQFSSLVEIISYPTELFWKVISSKSSPLLTGFGRGDYGRSYPSFKSFGSIVMLIPILEVLSLGYHIIYMDSDIALLTNPIEYLQHSWDEVDLIISQERRNCDFPSFIPTFDWSIVEPNTGFMFMKSNPRMINYFKDWLQEIVQNNIMNDQKVMYLNASYAIRSTVCNHPYTKTSSTVPNQSKKITFCFLNEFLFQNGKMEFFCSVGKEGSSISAYVLGMQRYGMSSSVAVSTAPHGMGMTTGQGMVSNHSLLTWSHYLTKPHALKHPSHSLHPHHRALSTSSPLTLYHPILLHVNYVGDKEIALRERGLWLYQRRRQSCTLHTLTKTIYGVNRNWTESIQEAIYEYQQEVQKIPNRSVVQLRFTGDLYTWMNHTLRYIPSSTVATKHSLDITKPLRLEKHIYILFPHGVDLV